MMGKLKYMGKFIANSWANSNTWANLCKYMDNLKYMGILKINAWATAQCMVKMLHECMVNSKY